MSWILFLILVKNARYQSCGKERQFILGYSWQLHKNYWGNSTLVFYLGAYYSRGDPIRAISFSSRVSFRHILKYVRNRSEQLERPKIHSIFLSQKNSGVH